jgi:hypothetical protein
MEMMKRMSTRRRANQFGLRGGSEVLFDCVTGAGRLAGAEGPPGLVDEILISCISIDEGRAVGRA